MKLAAGDFAVWMIIAIIVGIAKLWNRFVSTQSESEEEPAPPPVRRARSAPPLPSRREMQRGVPPVVQPVTEVTRQEPPKDLREFMERLTRPPQPKPVTPPPVAPRTP